MFPPRRTVANKDIHHLSYRPVFDLSCNLCAMIRDGETTLQQPLTVADVGAAQGMDPRWEVFGEACVQIGFEPDESECKRLQQQYETREPGSSRKIMEPIALWHSRETRDLNVTRDPDASSFYEPNPNFFERLPDPTLQQVVSRVPVSALPLDEYEMTFDGTIDAIKLDVQAAELDVIKGAERHLEDGVLAIIAETLFTPHYIDQPWFGDLDAHMRARGYQVFDIDLRRWRRRNLPSQFDGVRVGGVSYGDVVYLKDPVAFKLDDSLSAAGHTFCKSGLERDKILKLAALAEYFSVPDYALEVLEFGRDENLIQTDEFDVMAQKLLTNEIVAWNDRNVMPT